MVQWLVWWLVLTIIVVGMVPRESLLQSCSLRDYHAGVTILKMYIDGNAANVLVKRCKQHQVMIRFHSA